jgi:hypothetical protein
MEVMCPPPGSARPRDREAIVSLLEIQDISERNVGSASRTHLLFDVAGVLQKNFYKSQTRG